MLPVVTLHVFGLKRGDQLYGYMYSVMGVASFASGVFVELWQQKVGYNGMLYICAVFSALSAVVASLYQFERVNYQSIADSKELIQTKK